MSEIKVGTVVRWYSQSQGYKTEKIGKVIEVVRAGQKPMSYVPSGCPWFGAPRKHESYVVAVKTKTYWP